MRCGGGLAGRAGRRGAARRRLRAAASRAPPSGSADQTDFCGFRHTSSGRFLWNRVALDLAADTGNDLSDNAHLLATLNLAVADAIIACWDSYYYYEFWRPITAIRLADTDGKGDTDVDTDWTPLIVTPPFPEYTSGHTSASSAATAVLADYFGNDTAFTVKSQTNLSWTRSFSSFSAALIEIADARVFGAIHFRAACDVAEEMGTGAAESVTKNMMERIHGDGE